MPTLDPELMRQILLTVEQHEPASCIGDINIEGRDYKLVSYHIKMLHEAGLLDGIDSSTGGDGFSWCVRSMTYSGHRLLDGIRSNTAWSEVKSEAKKRGLDLTIEAVKALAMKLFMAAVQ